MIKGNFEHSKTRYSINYFAKINQPNKFLVKRTSLNISMKRNNKPTISSRHFGKEIQLTNNLTVYNNLENIKRKKANDLKFINLNNNIKNKFQKNRKSIDRIYTQFNYNNKENDKNDLNITKITNDSIKLKIKSESDNDNDNDDNNSSTINNDDFDELEMKKEDDDTNQLKIYNENPQKVEEYFDDICKELINKEDNYLPEPDYMLKQNDINHRMRAILIDWLIDVHYKYKLIPQTIYITVNLIDRYLSINDTSRAKLQLVGITAMFIASKYEEIYPPELKDFVYITDNAYINKDVINMEYRMLNSLKFDLTFPTQWSFLEIFKKKLNLDNKTFFFSWFLMELSLINYKMLKFKMSLIAASAIYISSKSLNNYNKINFEKYTGYSESSLQECTKEIYEYNIYNSAHKLKAARNKFSSIKFEEVAKIELK